MKRKNRKLFSLAIKRDVKGSNVKIMSRGGKIDFAQTINLLKHKKSNVIFFASIIEYK